MPAVTPRKEAKRQRRGDASIEWHVGVGFGIPPITALLQADTYFKTVFECTYTWAHHQRIQHKPPYRVRCRLIFVVSGRLQPSLALS